MNHKRQHGSGISQRITVLTGSLGFLSALFVTTGGTAARAQDAELAGYFGFSPMEIVVVDDGFGPVIVADMNGDRLNDLVVMNNRKSRIELYYQQRDGEADESGKTLKVNELEPHWRYRKEEVSVSHRISAMVACDFDGNGRLDLIYAGHPSELVMLSQTKPGVFEMVGKRRVRNLSANRDGMFVTNLIGDDGLELAVLVEDSVHLYPIRADYLPDPVIVETGVKLAAIVCDDFDGDGRTDLLGVKPDNSSPVRLWLQETATDGSGSVLGAERRFEMPSLMELAPFHLPGESAAGVITIERQSKRIVLYELSVEAAQAHAGQEAPLTVSSFPGSGGQSHDVEVIDVNGDGLLDIVATDPVGNAILVYEQQSGRGIARFERYPTLAEPTIVALGDVDGDSVSELFVMSEEESVVGRSNYKTDGAQAGFSFPIPMPTEHELVALELVSLDEPTAAVISKDKRKHVLRLLKMDASFQDVSLGSLTRSPDTILSCDADQDGLVDLLLFTEGSPMIMVHQEEANTFKTFTEDDMGQFGLVSSANGHNTAVMDIDGDGLSELLIAERNFVRALRYESEPGAGISAGWQVVEQYNTADARSELVSLTTLGDRLVVGDKANRRLLVLHRDQGAWEEVESLFVEGFPLNDIHAGSFTGDGADGVVCVGADGFAIVRFSGKRHAMNEIAAWRNDEEDRLEHEITSADVNGDGFTDFVVLDAGEQMVELFTMSRAHRFLHAADFEVFQSKLFSGGDSREYEPRWAIVSDVTGDGANDIVLAVHDRLLIYPQSTVVGVISD